MPTTPSPLETTAAAISAAGMFSDSTNPRARCPRVGLDAADN